APHPGHALVAHDDEVRVYVGGHVADRISRIAGPGVALGLDAGRAGTGHVIGDYRLGQITRAERGTGLGAVGGREVLVPVRGHDVQVAARQLHQLDRLPDSLRRGRRFVGADDYRVE